MIILNIYTHNHINYKLFCIDKYINKCKERVDVDKHLNSVNLAELLIRFQSPLIHVLCGCQIHLESI